MGVKTAFVFPGQGSQRAGMLDAVPENEALDRLLDAAEALSDLELRTIARLGDETDLADTRVAQPLLYLADWAWGVSLIESGIEPDLLAGHSLGELAALAIAGVYSVEAGLELVVERSKLMASTAAATPGTMSAILGMTSDSIAEAITDIDGVWVANDNSAGQVVISGTHEGVNAASEALANAGARKIVPLKVAGPFHSPLMQPAAHAFAEIVRGAEFADATVPVLQNTDPAPTTDAILIQQRLMSQITSPVRWTETMATLASEGPTLVIECGPGAVLGGLSRKIEGVTALSVETAGIERILEEVS